MVTVEPDVDRKLSLPVRTGYQGLEGALRRPAGTRCAEQEGAWQVELQAIERPGEVGQAERSGQPVPRNLCPGGGRTKGGGAEVEAG